MIPTETLAPKQELSVGLAVREHFPFFTHNPDVVYLDSTATSLKPQSVIDAVTEYYSRLSVNIHRGVYSLSIEATERYEGVRDTVRKFLNASPEIEVLYTKGTTESINLLANVFEKTTNELAPFFSAWQSGLGPGDIILISQSEHHSNIVPWQMLALKTGARVAFVPVNPDGSLNADYLENLDFDIKKIKIISLSATSNVSGVVHDLTRYRELARSIGAVFIIDAAQAVCHAPFDYTAMGADFVAFSAHKMLGPTGLGVLLGHRHILNQLPPFHGGGDMILTVEESGTTYNESPHRFEAGTPPIAQVFGFGAAMEFLSRVGMQAVEKHERELTIYALEQLENEGWDLYGPSSADVKSGRVHKAGSIAFGLADIHPHDIGTILDEQGVAIRAGHHCAQILMKSWGVPATARASLYLYNDQSDIDRLVLALRTVKKIFKRT